MAKANQFLENRFFVCPGLSYGFELWHRLGAWTLLSRRRDKPGRRSNERGGLSLLQSKRIRSVMVFDRDDVGCRFEGLHQKWISRLVQSNPRALLPVRIVKAELILSSLFQYAAQFERGGGRRSVGRDVCRKEGRVLQQIGRRPRRHDYRHQSKNCQGRFEGKETDAQSTSTKACLRALVLRWFKCRLARLNRGGHVCLYARMGWFQQIPAPLVGQGALRHDYATKGKQR